MRISDWSSDVCSSDLNKGRAMSKGEIGCYASHFSIWRDMIERGVRQAIVLEDDTVVDWAYLEPLARTDLHADGIDYLRLYAKRQTWQRVVKRDFLQHSRAIVELVDRKSIRLNSSHSCAIRLPSSTC